MFSVLPALGTGLQYVGKMNRYYTRKNNKKCKVLIMGIAAVLIVIGLVSAAHSEAYAISKNIPVPVISSETVTKPTLAWNSCGSAYTYRLYRSGQKNGTYTCVAKDISALKYTDNSAVAGKKYWYKVRATKVVKGNRIYGEASKPIQIAYVKNDLVLTLKVDKTGTYLQWDDLKNSKYRYNVYNSSSVNGKYNCVRNGLTENSYKLNLTSKTGLYYYRVRPYKMLNGRKVYGAMSNICLNRKVVDLVIFMGQSNMAGRGENASLAPVLEINSAYEFKAVTDPTKLYTLQEPFGKYENVKGAINDVSAKKGTEVKSGGMTASLCKAYFETAGVPIVGVSASISGTSVRKFQPGQPILNDAVTRLNTAKSWLDDNGYNVRHIYMVWSQGEADYKEKSETYKVYLRKMIEEMRKHGVEMCFFVGIGNHLNYPGIFDSIQNTQMEFCATYEYAYMTTTIARTFVSRGMMSYLSHYSQEGYNLVGKEAGLAMANYVNALNGK
ncbi:MAG: hypothetical protein K2O02_04335 [Lachnospiraceae bacterium]|nr:hypothetical protein [Lachnospiraceae bacterium]